MNKRGLIGFAFMLFLLLIAGFFFFIQNYYKSADEDNQEIPQISNPASRYCINQGHKIVIRDEEEGQRGYCVSNEGEECEEWDFYRGKCQFKGSNICIPNSCCHATSCVLSNETLSCDGVSCTMECRERTLDCGQGECAFIEGNCEVIWYED